MEKKRETTTLSVHRCRFVDYAPSAITALAYPPLSLPSIKGKKKTAAGKQPLRFGLLAVGHANGNTDICEWMGRERDQQCSQAWVVRKILPGPYPSKVDSLALVIRHPEDLGPDDVPKQPDLRLFSSGGGSELIEWDLERGSIRRTISSQGGSIWSVAVNPSSTSLALGCEDGTVRILSVANDTLTHSRRFDRVKCRVLSIAWGPPMPRRPSTLSQKTAQTQTTAQDSSDGDEDEDEWTDSWLITGGSDSSLRKWDVATGRVVERMGVDKAHGADVLCMVISPEGKAVYTAGVDQKTVQFSLVKTSSTEKGPTSSLWTQTTSRRMHSHDIRALAIWPPYTPLRPEHKRAFPIDVAPVLASGGLDMSVVLTPAALPTSTVVKVTNPLDTSVEATFEDSYHRKLAYVSRGAVRVAKTARLVSCAREAGLSVWRIRKKREEQEEPQQQVSLEEIDLDGVDEQPFAGGWEKVLEMDLDVHSNIVAHEISDDGRWLVVSDLYETKLFSLHTDDKGQINLKRIKDFATTLQSQIPTSYTHPASTGGLSFRFTPDSSKLVMSTAMSSYVLVVDLTCEKPRVLRRFDHHRMLDSVVHDRVMKGRVVGKKSELNGRAAVNGDVEGDKDVEMGDADSPPPTEHSEDESEESEREDVMLTAAVVSIDQIAISTDGQWLATSDNKARTHVFNLDSISYHTVLPSFHRPAQVLAFDPVHPSVLLLAFPDNTIQIYDVETRQFPTWGKELASSLPKRFTNAHDTVLGAAFDPLPSPTPLRPASGSGSAEDQEQSRTRYVLFWGATWLYKVNLDTRMRAGGKKRRREAAALGMPDEERQWRDSKMVTTYRPILCCDFLGKDELVVVERPLVDILLTLPPAYFKHKYGAS
ncbi:hypothetical protein NLJ89_g5832 [Agrocybe chaxingu]|uniref:WD40 repeat-like protein n=1 Tax=Agrocybe chaxingu TaxID=84603 RepID=A0A9W8K6P8_9AGAR|nr:hypothetical protein NLJ89_g5832 [Agrocybe chaxingu]